MRESFFNIYLRKLHKIFYHSKISLLNPGACISKEGCCTSFFFCYFFVFLGIAYNLMNGVSPNLMHETSIIQTSIQWKIEIYITVIFKLKVDSYRRKLCDGHNFSSIINSCAKFYISILLGISFWGTTKKRTYLHLKLLLVTYGSKSIWYYFVTDNNFSCKMR